MSTPVTSSPTTLTTGGQVRGTRVGAVHRYLGIPYAADPVGAARFRPPAKPDSWEGVRDCTAASPAPPQGPDFLLEGVVGVEPVATDEAGSLTVNVWTPARSGRRPVMVWIHGGGYIQGWGTQPWTDGARLAERQDVVVVSLNYRIGALGWLYVPELLGDDYADCANLGLQDQIAALAWVRDNIAHFGGDPESVTVFGESAGGGSAAMLLGAPAARPLLHRAILQSPPPRGVLDVQRAAAIAREYAGILRERAGDDAAEADVRTASPAQLLAAQEELVARHGLDLPLAPVVDGTVLPLPPIQALRNGSCAHIPVLAGTNEHEGRLFTALAPPVPPEAFDAALTAAFPSPERGARARAVYEAHEGSGDGAATARLGALITDQLFRAPTDALLEAQVAGGGRAWSYMFRWPTPVLGGVLGSAHTLDIPYVFDVLDTPGFSALLGDEPPRGLASAMSGAWAHFARHGRPSHELLPEWPEFEPSARPTMILDAAPRVAEDPLGERRKVWAE